MAEFRHFLNENIFSGIWGRLLNWLNTWWVRIKAAVLSSVKINTDEQSATFSFPGSVFSESYAGNKGLRIMQNIDTSTWKPSQQKTFASQVQKNIRNIASPLGFRLEIDVVLHLVAQYKMSVVGSSIQELQSRRQELSEKIQFYLTNNFVYEQFDQYVKSHAVELADAIYKRTRELLRCDPIEVSYHTDFSGQKADLKMLCKRSNTAWSLKYVSEGLVSVRTLSMYNAYRLLGGRDNSKDETYFSDLAETGDATEIRRQSLDDLWSAIEDSDWTSDPNNFARLLTSLLRGDDKSLMAIKNYNVNKMTVGEPSAAMAANFKTRTGPNGIIFSPLPGATITANKTKEYIRLYYTLGTSKHPTYIAIEPNLIADGGVRGVQFRINNLAG